MKILITLLLVIIGIETSIAQEQSVETKSIELDNIISFIANNYPLDHIDDKKNITILIQSGKLGLENEDEIILRQALKFLSNRLTEDDRISIVAYSGLNGLVLEYSSAKNLKKILNSINNIKSHINKIKADGIAFAYSYANSNFDEKAINTVLMIRNPYLTEKVIAVNSIEIESQESPKKSNSILLLTAITLLPELISIIKD